MYQTNRNVYYNHLMKLTLKELNEKIWYRLIKVVTVAAFGFVSFWLILFSLSAAQEYNTKYTRITCNVGNEGRYDVKKSQYLTFEEYIGPTKAEELVQEFCDVSETFAKDYISTPCNGYSDPTSFLSCNSGFVASNGVSMTNWLKFTLYFIGLEILLVGAFEALRRTFYYVVLGTVKPKR